MFLHPATLYRNTPIMMTLHRERSLSEIQHNIVTGSTQKKGKLADGKIPLSAGGGRGTA